MKRKILPITLALVLSLALLTVGAAASEGEAPVARIGETPYDSLDEAVAAAEEGATIELLADATTNGLNLSKDLTITAATGLEETPTITFTQYGIALWGVDLTFKDVNVVMNGIGSTPYTAEWNWMTICASVNASMTLDNVDMTMDATGTTNSPHAIYFCNNNVLNVVNGSNLIIKNYPNDALEWDGGNGGYNVNITDSTFVSDHNRSGFTGTFYATITDSKVDVINSTGNGSNGSHFIIQTTDTAPEDFTTTVNFSDNGSHGLSAGELSITNSTVTCNNNHGMGITVNNNFTVKNSIVTVEGNADNSSYGYAAVRLYNNFEFSVDSTSKLYIRNNNNTGLYVRQGKLTVADGAVLEITGNKVTHNALGGYGGGIYVGYGDNYDPTVVLPADAKIYNNHAITGGDDIYVSEDVNGPSLTFGHVGTDWYLDGEPDCEDYINGWYDDSEGTRWEAHADNEDGNHIEEFTNFNEETGLATVTGLTSLKAAHGLKFTITINYINRETGEAISEQYSVEEFVGNPYDVTSEANRTVPGYTRVSSDGDAVTGTLNSNKVINVYYTKNVPITPPSPRPGPDIPDAPSGLNTDDHIAYIIGYPDGGVHPEGNITRAEVATIFFRLLTDETRDEYWSKTNGYTDVPAESWFNNAISTLSNMGIIDGYADGTFRPDAPITRAEFTKIAVSFFEYADYRVREHLHRRARRQLVHAVYCRRSGNRTDRGLPRRNLPPRQPDIPRRGLHDSKPDTGPRAGRRPSPARERYDYLAGQPARHMVLRRHAGGHQQP